MPSAVAVRNPVVSGSANVQDTDRGGAAPSGTTVKYTAAPAVSNGNATMHPSPVNENNAVSARVQRVMENNRLRYIIVKDGDTRAKLEDEFQLLHWELSGTTIWAMNSA